MNADELRGLAEKGRLIVRNPEGDGGRFAASIGGRDVAITPALAEELRQVCARAARALDSPEHQQRLKGMVSRLTGHQPASVRCPQAHYAQSVAIIERLERQAREDALPEAVMVVRDQERRCVVSLPVIWNLTAGLPDAGAPPRAIAYGYGLSDESESCVIVLVTFNGGNRRPATAFLQSGNELAAMRDDMLDALRRAGMKPVGAADDEGPSLS